MMHLKIRMEMVFSTHKIVQVLKELLVLQEQLDLKALKVILVQQVL